LWLIEVWFSASTFVVKTATSFSRKTLGASLRSEIISKMLAYRYFFKLPQQQVVPWAEEMKDLALNNGKSK